MIGIQHVAFIALGTQFLGVVRRGSLQLKLTRARSQALRTIDARIRVDRGKIIALTVLERNAVRDRADETAGATAAAELIG